MRYAWCGTRLVQTGLSWFLAFAVAAAPSVVARAQQPAPKSQRSVRSQARNTDTSPNGPELKYVTDQAVLAAYLRPRQVLTAPELELLPIEVLTALGQKELGIDPVGVADVLAMVEPPMAGPPGAGVVIRFVQPFRVRQLPAKFRRHTTPDTINGRPYLRSNTPMLPSFFLSDDKTLIVATDGTLRRMVDGHAQRRETPLRQTLSGLTAGHDFVAAVSLSEIRPLIMAQLQQVGDIPPQVEPLLEIPKLVHAVTLTVNLRRAKPSELVVIADDEAAARRIERLVNQGLDTWRQTMLDALARQRASDDPVERALARYVERVSRVMIDVYRPTRDGKRLALFGGEGKDRDKLASVAVAGILVALLLPAVQGARESARRIQSMNKMKQIILAMHNYEAVHKRFPAPATYGPKGKPLLSWRIELLPYLEEDELYKAFRKDEPWDSPHNKKLIARMPDTFRNPNSKWKDKTGYLAPAGKGLLMDGTKGARLADIRDGLSNTIALLEVNNDRAVVWTKPADWHYNPQKPLAGLGGMRPGGFLAALCDGSVRFISESIDVEAFKAMLTRAGRDGIGSTVDK